MDGKWKQPSQLSVAGRLESASTERIILVPCAWMSVDSFLLYLQGWPALNWSRGGDLDLVLN